MIRSLLLEIILLCRCFTFRRGLNLVKISSSLLLSKFTKHPFVWGYPYAASIEPTSRCNLHCAECPSGNGSLKRAHGFMSIETYKQIIDGIHKYTFYINLYFQGEPMLHPQFAEMVAYAKSKKMFVFTSTNGHFLTLESAKIIVQSKLDKMIISLDGATQKEYEQYRIGGNLATVIKGMESISSQKKQSKSKTPIVIAQILLLKTTENSLLEIKKLAIDGGVNYSETKKAQFYHPNSKQALLPSNPKFLRYAFASSTGWSLINKQKKGCNRLWNTTVITWNGAILPCCYDKDATHKWGSITDENLNTIFHAPHTLNFRKKVLSSRSNMDICSNCGE